jgi:hypothetical protein
MGYVQHPNYLFLRMAGQVFAALGLIPMLVLLAAMLEFIPRLITVGDRMIDVQNTVLLLLVIEIAISFSIRYFLSHEGGGYAKRLEEAAG